MFNFSQIKHRIPFGILRGQSITFGDGESNQGPSPYNKNYIQKNERSEKATSLESLENEYLFGNIDYFSIKQEEENRKIHNCLPLETLAYIFEIGFSMSPFDILNIMLVCKKFKYIIKHICRFRKIDFTQHTSLSYPKFDNMFKSCNFDYCKHVDLTSCKLIGSIKFLNYIKLNLKELKISDTRIKNFDKHIPQYIDKISNVENFEIGPNALNSLKFLANMPNLKKIFLDRFYNLPQSEIDLIAFCQNLEELEFDRCRLLDNIDFVKKLPKLKSLKIYGCQNLKKIPDLRNLTDLKIVAFVDCKGLDNITGFDNCISITAFNIIDCPKVNKLPENLCKCEILNVKKCKSLTNLNELTKYSSLIELICIYSNIGNMPNESMSPITNCHQIRIIDASGNPLTNLDGFIPQNDILDQAIFSNCPKLTDISALKGCTAEFINLGSCDKLRDIHALQFCDYLDELLLNDCPNITNFGSIRIRDAFQYLRILNINNCTKLEELPNINKSMIEKIKYENCDSLKSGTAEETLKLFSLII